MNPFDAATQARARSAGHLEPAPLTTSSADRTALIRTMLRIRAFEMRLLEMFAEGKLFGTTHTCIGQEACAAALYAHIDPERDAIFTNHRCHGHYLAYGGTMMSLMAEIMGKVGGVCEARGGSQHLCEGRFFSQGVQGGSLPIAAGYAFHFKRNNPGNLVVAHIGDGTLGEGVLYETLNIASLLSLPLLIVIEYNGMAQSTETARTTAGDVEDRVRAFGIEVDRRGGYDPSSLAEHLGAVVSHVRSGRPFVQVIDTFRLMAHSKGDDDRPKQLVERAWSDDFLQQLLERRDPTASELWQAAQEEVRTLSNELDGRELAPVGPLRVYADPERFLFESSRDLLMPEDSGGAPLRVNELLNAGIDRCMASNEDLILIGEDLMDPYGGAFKVTKGLSTKYGARVFSSPISEAAIVGLANGVALAGGKAIVEIMFGDFVALAADQIINQAAKMHFMYAGKVCVPTTIRLVSGGYRGYGPTHSQSLEARFCGVPGLKVVALSRRHDPRVLLKAAAVDDPNPVLFVENKVLYATRPHTKPPAGFHFVPTRVVEPGTYPSLFYTTVSEGDVADMTVVTYGGLTDMVEEALDQLIVDEELDFDYFVLTQVSPLAIEDILASVRRTRHVVVVEEGPQEFGVGSEVLARIGSAMKGEPFQAARVGALGVPIPNSRAQESEVLPSKARIIEAALSLT